MLIEFYDRLSKELILLFAPKEFYEIIFGSGCMKKLQSMFIGSIFVFERIDLDHISSLENIADRLDFSIDDSVFE